jgi:hypothetical protein
MPKNAGGRKASTSGTVSSRSSRWRWFRRDAGNALRRCSLVAAGAAVAAVKTRAQHEFSTLTGVKEDIPEVL